MSNSSLFKFFLKKKIRMKREKGGVRKKFCLLKRSEDKDEEREGRGTKKILSPETKPTASHVNLRVT
ncbi:hypothetical protein BDA96_07G017000 [Sorghum bicolor]|uniref:Uncharacterized protein n=2 Tax=Sorghum bicolor TaxID=4558 RepID=A0A921QKI5_SORBI|nr:hypothetical protein BDA96_07G017000 [Sorghum bicolor]KXG24263.1 hypothetical protein SORBI_3007G016300 [Sorghum bicolor]